VLDARHPSLHVHAALNGTLASAKREHVRDMFGAIACRYDLANHLLSCGCDFYWRKRAAKIVTDWKPDKIIDLATGTGDLALALKDKMPNAEVVAVDFSEEMLAIARRKGVPRTVAADALALPFEDGTFDCLTIAFGLRNLVDYAAALREMRRVLNSNGHLLILEFSLPRLSILRAIYRFYLHRCMPVIGSFLTNKKSAYDYLGESIENFPSGGAMLGLMEIAGFGDTQARPLTGGIVTIYTGEKRTAPTA
jgi:demethylmenaquinone methyltransferase/2-methoxy-6-polyprenyl-1,4-benzoquinol methylase